MYIALFVGWSTVAIQSLMVYKMTNICVFTSKFLPEIISLDLLGLPSFCQKSPILTFLLILIGLFLFYTFFIYFKFLRGWVSEEMERKREQIRKDKKTKKNCTIDTTQLSSEGPGYEWILDGKVFYLRKSDFEDLVDDLPDNEDINVGDHGEVSGWQKDFIRAENIPDFDSENTIMLMKSFREVRQGETQENNLYLEIRSLLSQSSVHLNVDIKVSGFSNIALCSLDAENFDVNDRHFTVKLDNSNDQ